MMTTDFPVLSVAIWLPILAGVALILADRAGSAKHLRWAALAASLAGFLVTIPVFASFDIAFAGMQFVEKRECTSASADTTR